MILNLKKPNQFVEYNHFKMETIWTVVSMMKPRCYMASIDLKDAYYCVPVNPEHQKYLKFMWKGRLYQFTC
jgi:carbamoylphosphate synthase large subunit